MKIIGLKSPYMLHHWKFMQGDPRLTVDWVTKKIRRDIPPQHFCLVDQFLKAVKMFNARMRFCFSLNSECFEEDAQHTWPFITYQSLSFFVYWKILLNIHMKFHNIHLSWSIYQSIGGRKRKSHRTGSSYILLKPLNELLVMSIPCRQ